MGALIAVYVGGLVCDKYILVTNFLSFEFRAKDYGYGC